ncbi:MAG: sugar ABC transporter ATP-binding protein [Solirubrobacteraceae bacterium]
MSNDGEVILRAEGISKVFGRTVALHGVDFNVYRRKVNALVGENGAGKSTLMGIVAGVHQPTAGQILFNGEPVSLDSPRAAGELSIRLIHQELQLFGDLSVAENIFAGAELRSVTGVRLRDQERRAAELLGRLDQSVSPRATMGELPVGIQQIVVICRALAQEVQVLIMDEPTSALSTKEVETLLGVIRGLAASGVAIVYISHRLEEITEIGDHVTVLRDGRLVAEAAVPDIDVHWIVEQMIGHDPDTLYPYEGRDTGAPALEVSDVTVPRADGSLLLDRVSFSLDAGEIVGLYGLMGAGRTELLETLIGLREAATGEIRVGWTRLERMDVGRRIANGMFLVPEDRQRQGLVQVMSVRENISLASLGALRVHGALSPRREAGAVRDAVRETGVKVADIEQPVTALSGGNQQKVVVARALMTAPRVLLMDDPMRGIDVGAKTELYRVMQSLARDGLAILFTSSDLLEVLGMADRILVLATGRVVDEFTRDEATAQALVAASNAQGPREVAV